MVKPIEFYDTPDACKIKLEFSDGKFKRYRCRMDISYNTVSEIYNEDDEIIAANMNDLRNVGVVRASVQATHKIELPTRSILEVVPEDPSWNDFWK